MNTHHPIKKIAITTGGGDAPGLNAVIKAATISALNRGWEVVGIRDAYNGIMFPKDYPEGGFIPLIRDTVRGITHRGGTILGTTNRNNPLRFPVTKPDGSVELVDRTDEILSAFRSEGIDALITVGGDGSLEIANALHLKGCRVVGVPKTIDNDLEKTVITFGFDTAVAFATECLDRLHTTAASHGRIMVVEVMGRYAGWIALNCGIAGSADVILIPEIPFDIDVVVQKILQRDAQGRSFSIVVVSEAAHPVGGKIVAQPQFGRQERLGGIGEILAAELEARTAKETRLVVLGHLLRGGSPTAFDRLTALRFGAAAVRALADGMHGVMVALDPPNVRYVPLEKVAKRTKTVPLDSDVIRTARDLGICLGDRWEG
jgi:6-phosphofructokinase 1